MHPLRRFERFLLEQRAGLVRARLEKQLPSTHSYSFTADWFSNRISVWQKHLAVLAGQPNLHALEIGSFEGRSALWLLEHILTDPSSTLTCVDPFLGIGGSLRFDHNIRLSGQATRVQKLQGSSHDVLPTLAREIFDLIYIDGSHKAADVYFDALLSWCLLKNGGILIFDDYLWQPPTDARASQSPKIAIDLFLEGYVQQLELLHRGQQVIVRKN